MKGFSSSVLEVYELKIHDYRRLVTEVFPSDIKEARLNDAGSKRVKSQGD